MREIDILKLLLTNKNIKDTHTNILSLNNFYGILFLFYKSPVYLAVQKGNIEILKLLLSVDSINPNVLDIFFYDFYNSHVLN